MSTIKRFAALLLAFTLAFLPLAVPAWAEADTGASSGSITFTFTNSGITASAEDACRAEHTGQDHGAYYPAHICLLYWATGNSSCWFSSRNIVSWVTQVLLISGIAVW